MKKLPNPFTQGLSIEASRATVDAVWSQGNGVDAYDLCGKIFVGCGVGWALMALAPIACGSPFGDCLWMFAVAAAHIVVGALIVILSMKSDRFQAWALRSFEKDLDRRAKMQSKLVLGDKTLRATYGDAIALAALTVIAGIIAVVLLIGTARGWVKW